MEKGAIFMEKEKPTYDFNVYFPTGEDFGMAQVVADWTKKYGNMLPKSVDEILSFFKAGNSILITNQESVLVSHAAITFAYPGNWKEVGGLVTNEDFRRMGAASVAVKELIKLALRKDPTIRLFALANKVSAGVFEKLGAEKMLSTQLPSEVWDPCKTCPNYKTPKERVIFQCCDIPYNLTNIAI